MNKPFPYEECIDKRFYLYRYDPRKYLFAEYEIDMVRFSGKKEFMMAFERGNPRHYWTRVPVEEGKPGMHCVWFTDRNPDKAIQILHDFEKNAITSKDEKILNMCFAYQGQKMQEWKEPKTERQMNNDGIDQA